MKSLPHCSPDLSDFKALWVYRIPLVYLFSPNLPPLPNHRTSIGTAVNSFITISIEDYWQSLRSEGYLHYTFSILSFLCGWFILSIITNQRRSGLRCFPYTLYILMLCLVSLGISESEGSFWFTYLCVKFHSSSCVDVFDCLPYPTTSTSPAFNLSRRGVLGPKLNTRNVHVRGNGRPR